MSDAEIVIAERERASNRVEKLQRDHAKERLELITSMMETVYQRDERVAELLVKLEEKDRLRHSEVSAARAEVDQARKRIAQLEREAELQVLENARKRKLETETQEVQIRGLQEGKDALQASMNERVEGFQAQIANLEQSRELIKERLAERDAALQQEREKAADRDHLLSQLDACREENKTLQQRLAELEKEVTERGEAHAAAKQECLSLSHKMTALEDNSVELLKHARQEKNKALAAAEAANKTGKHLRESVNPALHAFDELRSVSLLRRPFKKISHYKNLLQSLLKASDALRA